jgi:tetratricopeptide (TPR) repeat protein
VQTESSLFSEALKAHMAGDLAGAERLYGQTLAADPRHAQARANLATVWLQQGRFEDGVNGLRQSLEIDPAQPMALNNLGLALRGLGRLDEAIEAFHRSLVYNPRAPDTLAHYAALLDAAGRLEEAAQAFGEAAAVHPQPGPLRHAQGFALYRLGRAEEAIGPLRQAAELSPGAAEPLNDLGVVLDERGRLDEAREVFDKALALRPAYPEALNNRALVLYRMNRLADSLEGFDAALTLKPDYAAAWLNRADTLSLQGRFDDALASVDQALAVSPDYADAWSRRGDVLGYERRLEEAQACYAKALAIDPNHERAAYHLAFPLLRGGRYEEGLQIYENRWRGPLKSAAADLPMPLWLGREPVDGKTLLLHSEQGHGDTLMMLRYATLLAQRGATVIVSVQAPIETLAATVAGVSAVIPHGEPLPPYDLHIPMMSLPLAFATRPETIPGEPYLRAPEAERARWAERLGPASKPRVGLCWSGSPTHVDDRWRSIPLETLKPLTELCLDLYAVQIEMSAADRLALEAMGVESLGGELRDYADTAGLIENLDLVVSVDTSLVNLAGGLGRPAFVMLGRVADWRWGLQPDFSPWYPSCRLFRQETIGAWDEVVARVKAAVSAKLS